MTPQSVLVAGNMGYVGPAVTRRLREQFPCARLAGLDMGYFAHCLTGARVSPGVLLDVQHFADIRALPEDLLDGVDAVVNLAAISNDPMGSAFEVVTMNTNHVAAVNLAKVAKAKGVRSYTFASSCSVYGFAEGNPRVETDALDPLTAYARSKVATERSLVELASDDFVVTCLRFPTACGMSDRLRLDLVLNDFVASAIAAGRIDILSDGSPWRPLIDTNDMALAIEWAVCREAGSRSFLAVNVGRNECNYQIKDLARAVEKHLPGVSININPDAVPDKRSYQVNFDLYRELAPGHLPQYDLDRSIEGLMEGLQRMRFADREFRTSNYMRLKVLSGLMDGGLLDSQLRWIRVTDAKGVAPAA